MGRLKEANKQEEVVGRTLLIYTSNGEEKVTLPVGARVTFGPAVPFEKKDGYGRSQNEYSLRVYENALNNSLVAVFNGVRSFRDIAIPHSKLVVREAGKSMWKSDESGYKVEESVEREKFWDTPLKALED